MLIAVVLSGAATIDTPSGWTPAVTDFNNSATGIYWKPADPADTDVTFTFNEAEEQALMVFEYAGLADPPTDQTGTIQYPNWDHSSITITADAANSQDVELNVAGVLGWDTDSSITWDSGYVEAVEGFDYGYMNYGSATKITSSIETASTTATVDENMELYGVIATFKADTGTSTPYLHASETQVSMTAAQDGSSDTDSVTITTSDSATGVTVTATSDDGGEGWLSVDPTGSTPAALTITANPTGQTADVHTGTVTVTAAGYDPVTIDVSFDVTPSSGGIAEVQVADDYAYGSSVTASFPSAPQTGDMLIAVVLSGAATIDTPSGWTPAVTDFNNSATGIYWKPADPADTDVTFTFNEAEEQALMVFEYAGLADPPTDQTGTIQYPNWDHSSITITADAANSQDVELNVAGVLGWDTDSSITWDSGYVEAVEGFDYGYMNYGSATKITSSIETASTTATVDENMELYGAIATFKADTGTSTPYLHASETQVSMTAAQDGSSDTDSVTITTSDSATGVTVTATSDDGGEGWLSVDPTGSTPAALTITANPTGQTADVHTGTVTVTAAGYDPVTIDVSFDVTPSSGGIAEVQVADDYAYGSSVTASFPSAPQTGDMLIAVVLSGAATIDTPSGWTPAVTDFNNSATGIYWKPADPADTDVTFTFNEAEEQALMVFEYAGLADPPTDQTGTIQYPNWDHSSITITADAANSQDVELNVAGVLGWDTDSSITWDSGYVEAVEGFDYGYMNYGSATKITSSIETASTTATVDENMELYGVIATFKADTGGGTAMVETSNPATSTDGVKAVADIYRPDSVNAQTTLLTTAPDQIRAVSAAMMYSTQTTVTETWYYQFGGQIVAMRQAVDGVDQGVQFLLSDHLGSTSVAYNPDTDVATRQFYYPWGGLRGSTDPVLDTDIGYTGQRLDTSTDLMYYQARYYDPTIGRFVSADTIVPQPGQPAGSQPVQLYK